MNQNNIFCQDNHITDTGVLDNMVLAATETVCRHTDATGVTVGEIKGFSLCFLPKVGEALATDVSIIFRKGRTIVAEASTLVDGETAAKCRIKFFTEKKDETAGNTL